MVKIGYQFLTYQDVLKKGGVMKENPWFIVAVIEMAILFLIFLFKVISMILKRSKYSEKIEKGRGQVGKVTNITRTTRGIRGIGGEVTVFEIEKEDGNIFLAGLYGHDNALYVGCSLEFWPSREIIALGRVTRGKENEDGTESNWQEKRIYYGLERFRILPEKAEGYKKPNVNEEREEFKPNDTRFSINC